MCLIGIALEAHADFPLIVVANRDEFYARPTARAHFWAMNPNILAGRDLVQGGTWMGVTKDGRFAAVTNYRMGDKGRVPGLSRGHLVREYLESTLDSDQYAERLKKNSDPYSPFSLIFGNFSAGGAKLLYYSNLEKFPRPLERGVHALSNHFLNTPWPKVERIRGAIENILKQKRFEQRDFFRELESSETAEKNLPNTGVPLELEKKLSAIHIRTRVYGTVSATVLLVRKDGRVCFTERRYVE